VPPRTTGQNLTLEIPPDPALASLALSLPAAAGRHFALAEPEVLRLTLAMEELFLYACQVADRSGPVSVRLSGLGPSVRASFGFHAAAPDVRFLNFAARIAPDQGRASEMGLYLASRTTDRCTLERLAPDSFSLSAEVDRSYPEEAPLDEPLAARPPFALRANPPEEMLRQAARLGAGLYPDGPVPPGFGRPGRLLAEVRDGLRSALAVAGEDGLPAGLILWRLSEAKAALFSGPYVFVREGREEVARLLSEGLLAVLARTGVLSAVSARATPDAPPGLFEPLGRLAFSGGSGSRDEQVVLYRSLGGDRGAQLWVHPGLEGFVRERCRALALSRDIQEGPGREAGLPAHSLLSTRADRLAGVAVLKPLLDGWDLAENLAAHVHALRGSGLPDLLFHLDLGLAWQAAMVPDLTRAGFAPRLLLPRAGAADLLVLEHDSSRA
jgi:hypothetical protein